MKKFTGFLLLTLSLFMFAPAASAAWVHSALPALVQVSDSALPALADMDLGTIYPGDPHDATHTVSVTVTTLACEDPDQGKHIWRVYLRFIFVDGDVRVFDSYKGATMSFDELMQKFADKYPDYYAEYLMFMKSPGKYTRRDIDSCWDLGPAA